MNLRQKLIELTKECEQKIENGEFTAKWDDSNFQLNVDGVFISGSVYPDKRKMICIFHDSRLRPFASDYDKKKELAKLYESYDENVVNSKKQRLEQLEEERIKLMGDLDLLPNK